MIENLKLDAVGVNKQERKGLTALTHVSMPRPIGNVRILLLAAAAALAGALLMRPISRSGLVS